MAIESLLQQTSVFSDSLNIRGAAAEKTADENGQQAKTPEQGDTVTISEEARALAAPEESEESEGLQMKLSAEQSEDTEESEADRIIRMLKQQIEKLEEEIKELEESDMPEKTKRTMIQDKQAQLMELNDQLAEAMENKLKGMGTSPGGGTRAQGFGNSVASF